MKWWIALHCLFLMNNNFALSDNADQWPSLNKLKSKTPATVQQKAVEGILQRLIGNRTADFQIEIDPDLNPSDKSTYILDVNQTDHRIKVIGNSGVAAAFGFQSYLKYWTNCHVSWSGDQLNLPVVLPQMKKPIQVTSNDQFRYYQNVCTVSYSSVWWSWSRWEREIDWMALNGINLPLAFTGQEAIWTKVYTQLGFSKSDLDAFYTGPAFLAWNRMGNVDGWAGKLSDAWQQKQLVLQQLILQRMRSLGMIPVLPAFSGHVPRNILKVYPNATVSKMANWGRFNDTYCCTYLLHPSDELFQTIGALFVQEMTKAFNGTDHIYNCDAFNEMDPPTQDLKYIRSAGAGVYKAMKAADSDAVWLMQGWLFNSAFWTPERAKALLTSVPLGNMIVLDLQAELTPKYEILHSFFGQPFIWCMLHNFGGVLGMYGAVDSVNTQPFKARSAPNSTMVGTGITPEGIEQNDVMYEFMNEMAWNKVPVDVPAWFNRYAARRYGSSLKTIGNVWSLLSQTVFNCTDGHKQHGGYLIVKRPSLRLTPPIWYSPRVIFNAWKQISTVSRSLTDISTLRYDVADITREALQTLANQYYVNIIHGFKTKNQTEVTYGGEKLQQLFADLDELLGSDEHFLLGRWLESAKSNSDDAKEKTVLEYNARNQITLWGPTGNIVDYAAKQWSGLFSHYYAPRWRLFVGMLIESLKSKIPFDLAKFKQLMFSEIERPFTFDRTIFPVKPVGDIINISTVLYAKWKPQIRWNTLNRVHKIYIKKVFKRKSHDFAERVGISYYY